MIKKSCTPSMFESLFVVFVVISPREIYFLTAGVYHILAIGYVLHVGEEPLHVH